MIDPVYSSPTPDPNADDADTEPVLERIERCAKDISLWFDQWEDPYARGPGLYFVVGREPLDEFVAPMGENRWPVEDCASVFAGTAAFLAAAKSVALFRDGAVVVHSDGTIEEGMVRLTQLSRAEHRRDGDPAYAAWMGARHMSALETSTRREVMATITLSEEDGRVTVFVDGTFDDSPADTLDCRPHES